MSLRSWCTFLACLYAFKHFGQKFQTQDLHNSLGCPLIWFLRASWKWKMVRYIWRPWGLPVGKADFTWQTVSLQSDGKWRHNPAQVRVRTLLGSLFQRVTHKRKSIKPKISELNKSTKLTLSEPILRDRKCDSKTSFGVPLHFPCPHNESATSADLLLCWRIQWLK